LGKNIALNERFSSTRFDLLVPTFSVNIEKKVI